jgi:hypothetical protein
LIKYDYYISDVSIIGGTFNNYANQGNPGPSNPTADSAETNGKYH